MANATAAFGLRPVRHRNGSPWNGQTMKCYVSSSYATAIYIGDTVKQSLVAAEKDPTGRYRTVNKTTLTDGIVPIGVVVGIEPNPDNLNRVYLPASTGGIIHVCPADPDIVFQVRDDGGATPTSAFVGLNAIMVATSAGDTVTGFSGHHMDAGTGTAPGANQSYPLFILGLSDTPDNSLGINAVWDVILNTSYNATGLILGVTTTS